MAEVEVNTMESPDRGQEALASVDRFDRMERREFLTKAAAAGAIAWATPVILSRPAFAQVASDSCAVVTIGCVAPFTCDENGNNNDIFPSIQISVACGCGPLDWCFSYTTSDAQNSLFVVPAGGCPAEDDRLDDTVTYCGTNDPLTLIVGQGSGNEAGAFSITVNVQGTCGGDPFCQSVTISGDGTDDGSVTCDPSTPAACTPTGCTGCTPLPFTA